MKASTKSYLVNFIAVLGVIGAALFVSWGVKEHHTIAMHDSLVNMRDATKNSFLEWAESQEDDIDVLAADARLIALTQNLVAAEGNVAALLELPAQDRIRNVLKSVMDNKHYRGFFIIDQNNMNLASSRDSNVGSTNLLALQDGFLESIRDGNTSVSQPQRSDVPLVGGAGKLVDSYPTMFVAGPIRGADGRILAVLAFRIDPFRTFTGIFKRGRIGKSGETYAFSKSGTLISESRFDEYLREIGLTTANESSLLNLDIRDPGRNHLEDNSESLVGRQGLTLMAQSATLGNSDVNTDGYRDYRGVPVVGAWTWLSEYNFGIASELDHAEAYGLVDKVNLHIFGFASIIVIMLIGASAYYARAQKLMEANAIELTGKRDELAEMVAKNREVVNSAVDGIITIDAGGIIKTFNNAAERIFGYSIVEVVGKNVSMLMPKVHADNHDGYLKDYLETGKAKIIGASREVVGKRGDHTTILLELSLSEFRYADQITFVGIVRDITERKEAEYRLQSTLNQLQETQSDLVQAEKMASLGGLVAGVAHEINTPIGVGLTAASHLREKATSLEATFKSGQLKKSDFSAFIDTATDSTKIIETNLGRASDLIRSFKQVAVDQSSDEKRQIDLTEYVEEVLESLRPKLKRTAHEFSVNGDMGIFLETYPGSLSQIITNLVMNSITHAYDDGEKGKICIDLLTNGTSAHLIYRDDGKGMDEYLQSKIFEPFFTTKRGSGGSGLGMHILYNQVTQILGGSINLQSEPGKGSTFEIIIPMQQPVAGVTL